LNAGIHIITLKVTDEVGHTVNTTFKLEILPSDTDGDGLDDSIDTDDDGDGLPDHWELQNGLNPLLNDGGNDKDGDGFTNKEEFVAGTNPSDSKSHPEEPSGIMESPVLILVINSLILITILIIGFIIFRRHIKKRMIIPEILSEPKSIETSLPTDAVSTKDHLPGYRDITSDVKALRGTSIEISPVQYQLPPKPMSNEEMLRNLEQRLALGEISEKLYYELKEKYENKLQGEEVKPKKKKVKKRRADVSVNDMEEKTDASDLKPEQTDQQ
jgi:hypothetical protein